MNTRSVNGGSGAVAYDAAAAFGTSSDMRVARRAVRLADMLAPECPPCADLAFRVWLVARTSGHRGEVYGRALVAWVLWRVVAPFLRRAQVRRLRGPWSALVDLVGDVAEWASDRGVPRGSEHWSAAVAWWEVQIAEEEGRRGLRRKTAHRAASIAADLAAACDAVVCATPASLAERLRRVVDFVVRDIENFGTIAYHRAVDEFAERWQDDLAALVDARADRTWALLDAHDACAECHRTGRVHVVSDGARVVEPCPACACPECGARPTGGAFCVDCGGAAPFGWDAAQREADAREIASLYVPPPADDREAWWAARTCALVHLGAGLAPLELVAARALGIPVDAAVRLRVDGYLSRVLREGAYPGGASCAACGGCGR